MAVEKKGKGKGKGVVLLWKTTLQGCLIGMLFGVLIGLLLGAPMSLVAYGSTKDAIKDGLLRKFSMDKNKTDIPDVVAAQYLEAHWGEVVQFILRDHLFTVLAIGACVGLVFGMVATLANQIGSQVAFSSAAGSHVEDQHADMRRRLLPMR